MDPLTIGLGILGSMLGSEGQQSGASRNESTSGNTSSSGEGFTQNFIDPRFEPYIYGDGGILGSAYDWYNQNRSGTNAQSLEGMNNQWAQLGASKQGFDAMQQQGMRLMGQPVAGNPFSSGYQGGGTFPTTGLAAQNFQYTPAQFGQGGPFVQQIMPSSNLGMVGVGEEAAPVVSERFPGLYAALQGFAGGVPVGTSPYDYRGGSRTNEGIGRDDRGYGGGDSGGYGGYSGGYGGWSGGTDGSGEA